MKWWKVCFVILFIGGFGLFVMGGRYMVKTVSNATMEGELGFISRYVSEMGFMAVSLGCLYVVFSIIGFFWVSQLDKIHSALQEIKNQKKLEK